MNAKSNCASSIPSLAIAEAEAAVKWSSGSRNRPEDSRAETWFDG